MDFAESFLLELFNLCFHKREMLDICCQHLKYEYIPKESYKYIWKAIKNYYQTSNKIPTIGLISQQYSTNKEIIEDLNNINQTNIPDLDSAIIKFEEYIKDNYFNDVYDKLANSYNSGNKNKTFNLIKEAGDYLNNFSLKKSGSYYERVFEGYNERTQSRIIQKTSHIASKTKIPFFIDEIDNITYGGCDKGDTWLGLAQSGVGKSKYIKWNGVNAARLGNRVLHIQAEGSKRECMNLYDATWTSQAIYELETGNISTELQPKLKKIVNDIIVNDGEIYVYAAEKFDSISMMDIRNIATDVERNFGPLDCILLDYLDEIEPGDGKTYHVAEEKQRKAAIAKGMKNLAVEKDVVFGSCVQAGDIMPDKLNDPKFVLTRHHTSGDRTLIKPFSYFFTMNQTEDEYNKGYMRLYWEKIRKYKGRKLIHIAQAYEYEKFYDRKKTIELFNDK